MNYLAVKFHHFDTPNLSAYAADSRLIQYTYRFDLLLSCVSLHLFMHVGQLSILCRAAIKKVRTFLVLRNCKVVICMKCWALHWINMLLVYLWVVGTLAPSATVLLARTYPHVSTSSTNQQSPSKNSATLAGNWLAFLHTQLNSQHTLNFYTLYPHTGYLLWTIDSDTPNFIISPC